MLKPLIDRCVAAWRAAAEEIGFRRRYGLHTIDVNEDVFGRLGLGHIAHRASRSVELNPVVWVCHVPLEMKVAELTGGEAPKRYKVAATIVKQLGYLTPRGCYTPWWFTEDSDIESLAREMAACVVEYAFPFYQEHATLAAVYESMRTKKYGADARGFGYRLPVAALMLGMPDAARVHIAERLMQLEEYLEFRPAQRLPIPREVGVGFRLARSAKPGIVAEYRAFAERLLELIEKGGIGLE